MGLETIATMFRATRPLSDAERDALYSSDGIARKTIDLPIEAAFGAWCTIEVEPGWELLRDEVVALATRLGVPSRYRQAEARAAIDGHAAVVLGYADGARFDTPAAAGATTPIWVRSAYGRHCIPTAFYGPTSPRYGEASWMRINRILPDYPEDWHQTHALGLVHASRFCRLGTSSGSSDYQLVANALANLLAGADGTGSLLQRAALGVFRLKQWQAQSFAQGPSAYDYVQAQYQLINTARAIVLDSDREDFKIDGGGGSGLSGAESAVYALSWIYAATASIPMTLLFGLSPSGFSSGEGERKDWEARARARRARAEPAIRWIYDRLWAEVLGEACVPAYNLVWPDVPITPLEKAAAATSAIGVAERALAAGLTTPSNVVAGFSETRELNMFVWETPEANETETRAGAEEEAAEWPSDLEDPKVLGAELAVSPATLAGMAERGEIPRYKVGKRWRYSRSEVAAAILQASQVAAGQSPTVAAARAEEEAPGASLETTDPPGSPGPDRT